MRRTLLMLSVLFVAYAQSQPPSPSPSKISQNDKRKEETKSVKTDLPDQSVTATPIPVLTEKNTRKEADDRSHDAPSNWWLIIPTIVIAIATTVQVRIYWRQTEYMRNALEQTKIAAIKAERTLHLTERADVLVDKIELTTEFLASAHVVLRLRNFGRTRANITRMECHYGVKETGHMDGFRVGFPEDTRFVLGAEHDVAFTTRHALQQLIGDDWQRTFQTVDLIFRVWGKITYADVFDEEHTVEFSARFVHPDSFVMEYNRSEQQPLQQQAQSS